MPDFMLSLNSSTIKPTPILEKIRIAGEVGYAGIELWHDDIDAHLAGGGTLTDIQNALDDQGLLVPTTIYLKGWFETEGDERPAVLDECRRRLDQAAAVGAVHAVAGPPAGVADRDLGARHYCELLEMGKKVGVKPAMEYLGFVEDINTIEDALDVIQRSGHADATIVHDPFHIFRGGGSIQSLSKTTADQIAICHFNDAPVQPPREQQHDPDRVMPGEGHLDLQAFLNQLRSIGYDGWLSLELFNEELWAQDPQEVAQRGLEAMREIVEA